ncbi:MAG: radical SAM protein [Candidatus Hydrogenedentota bacterium]
MNDGVADIMIYPVYLTLSDTDWKNKIEWFNNNLSNCTLCPRECKANRLKNEKGYCRTGKNVIVSSAMPHFGEERVLVGRFGSGTVFFSGCNLRCIFCQNYDISQQLYGKIVTNKELTDIFLYVQSLNCHNLNLVSPTHCIAQIIEALYSAIKKGFKLPIVYNSGGYDSIETLKRLDGIIDIYMPDMKYSDPSLSFKYSDVPNYPEINREASIEMQRQVGDLVIENGIAKHGLLIRHLVLPHSFENSKAVLDFIKERISVNAYINIMDQYHPCYKADEYKELSRGLLSYEYDEVLNYAHKLGFKRIDGLF